MRQLGLTVHLPDKAYHGYTLFAPLSGTNVYLIDMRGGVVHRWNMPYRLADYGYLLENGNLLFSGLTGKSPAGFGGSSGIVMEVDWTGDIVWQYEDASLHHDFCRMSNGNTMLLGWASVPPEVASRIKGGKPGTEHERGIWCDYFREVTPRGETVWEWYAYQHLDTETDLICPLHSRSEWTHCNALEVLPDGNLLTSFRLLDTVAIIDKKSGDFVWKWGREELGHQHNPNPLENGNILIFDNGWHGIHAPHPRSRVLEVDPRTDHIEWIYQTRPGWEFFSAFISGAQRLPNANTLICEGMTGRLFEVTSEGEVVWEYMNPFFGDDELFGWVNHVFRAYRYGPDFPGFEGHDLNHEKHSSVEDGLAVWRKRPKKKSTLRK